MNKKWCICNNTGCIFIRASDFNYSDIEELAFSCPICQEDKDKIHCILLVEMIKKSIKDNKKIVRFRLNTYQMICLSESMVLNFVTFNDNKFYGIPIEIDNDVETIQYDYI